MNRAYTKEERLLTIDNLRLEYNSKVILRDVNLHIDNIVRPDMEQGQVVALLGPSGVGKTQLFRCIAGLQSPTQGGVYLVKGGANFGAPGNIPVQAGDVGVVFQNYPLFKHRTIMSNLLLAAGKKREAEVMVHLERFGLSDKRGLYPAQLSGGQRQRIAIIQQLLSSDNFLLMDEPFSGLDIKMKDEAIKVIHEVSVTHEHNTTIVTTHDIDAAVRIADTVWVLGQTTDPATNVKLPGGTCIKVIDLIDRGLAWNPDVENHPNFMPTVREIRELFH